MSANDPYFGKRYKWLVDAIKSHKSDKCLLWPFTLRKNGYGRVRIPSGPIVATHRLAYKLAKGRWPIPCALPTCDVPRCVNPKHIKAGTKSENTKDRERKGRGAKGERIHGAKLTPDLVRIIRKEYKPCENGFKKVADKYGVSWMAIYYIINGKNWRHVK